MVYTLGEMLLDVITEKEIPRESYVRHGYPGGAMLNAAVSLARTNVDTALISEVGDDAIGSFLTDFLKENYVETRYILQYQDCFSPVALARLDARKKPTYTFQKSYPAQRSLTTPTRFTASDMLLFGSLYALDPDIRPEIRKILYTAAAAEILVMYDPNIRQAEQLSNNKREEALFENLKLATIIKGSDEDFDTIFGRQSPEKHITTLQNTNPEAIIFITLGAQGALAAWKNQIIKKPAQKIMVVSTIGAGDGFNAGLLAEIVHSSISKAELPQYLEKLLDSGIAFSAAVCNSADNYIPKDKFYIC